MTGYAIFQIEITNPEEYKNYVAKASGLVAKYGGEYLVEVGIINVLRVNGNSLEQSLSNFLLTKKL